MTRNFGSRLADAVILLLVLLLPVMLVLGAGERSAARPTLVFWLLLVLPLVICPWLMRRAHPMHEGHGRAPSASPPPLPAPTVDHPPRPESVSSTITVNVLLFLATVLTTTWAGAMHQGVNLLSEPDRFATGLPYAAALLAILGVHEFGHYFFARRHGVNVTLPYFIPVPMGLGTLGAFIQIRSAIKSRRAVFDIGIAGPLAGLVVAVPALYFGLRGASPLDDALHIGGVYTGSSLLLSLIYQFANGGALGADVIRLSPIAFAGWIGLFITALNLLPVGQLDGGHIAYGLFGRRAARTIGFTAVAAMIGLGLFVWPGLLAWAVFVAFIAGFSHAPTLDDVTPPDGTRFALGAAALAVLILTLMPLPGGMRGLMLDCPFM